MDKNRQWETIRRYMALSKEDKMKAKAMALRWYAKGRIERSNNDERETIGRDTRQG